jgi:dolichol-phosphate mannosyltransferase
MRCRALTALPVYNEVRHITAVLDEVRRFCPEILVVNDGSSDGTADLLAQRRDIHVVTHEKNQGYGAALRSAFAYAQAQDYDLLVTIDCDGQHEPQLIPEFIASGQDYDIVSGSRYLQVFEGDSQPPAQRRWINQQITAEINRRLGLQLTDAFCGFKAYSVPALRSLELRESGYSMPLELWVQVAAAGLRIREMAVPLIYLDASRSFGGSLDDAATRLQYYHQTLDRSIAAAIEAGKWPRQSAACGEKTG